MHYDLLARVMQTARMAGFKNISLQVNQARVRSRPSLRRLPARGRHNGRRNESTAPGAKEHRRCVVHAPAALRVRGCRGARDPLLVRACRRVLGVLWILLVLFLPAPPNSINLLKEEEPVAIDVKPEDVPVPTPAPVAVASAGGAPKMAAPAKNPGGGKRRSAQERHARDRRRIRRRSTNNTGGMVGDVSNALRGTEVATGTGSDAGRAGKGGDRLRRPAARARARRDAAGLARGSAATEPAVGWAASAAAEASASRRCASRRRA